MAENTFYYDGSLCIACRSCQVACKQWNYLPGEKTKFFAAATLGSLFLIFDICTRQRFDLDLYGWTG